MSYPTYLIHFNKNHDKRGRFTSGDGDNDGILDDHHNYAKNKQAQSKNGGGGGASSLDKMIGDQIDEMVQKYNNPEKITTYKLKKDDKNKKKKKTGSKAKKSTKKKEVSNKIIASPTSVVNDNSDKPADTTPQISPEEIEKLINGNLHMDISFLQRFLGK